MKQLLLILFFLKVFIACTQVELAIDTLNIFDYNVEIEENIIFEDMGSGPFVSFECFIVNNTDSSLKINPILSDIYISYKYNGNNYQQQAFPLPFLNHSEINIVNSDTISFFLVNIYFLEQIS